MGDISKLVTEKWAHRADVEAIREGLSRRGLALEQADPETLAVHDQLHVGQMTATRALTAWVAPGAGSSVLDLGAGLGGTARFLAHEHQCKVTALELSEALHLAGLELTQATGSADLVDHVQGDAVGFCGTDGFDLIWVQHVDMHVSDKAGLYGAVAGSLAQGGRAVWHDWLAGEVGAPRYPVPWSEGGEISFLSTRSKFEDDLAGAGLQVTRFADIGERTLTWLTTANQILARFLDKHQGAGHPRAPEMATLLQANENLARNIRESRMIPCFAEARLC